MAWQVTVDQGSFEDSWSYSERMQPSYVFSTSYFELFPMKSKPFVLMMDPSTTIENVFGVDCKSSLISVH
jgi:hypothetical protein